MLSDNEVIEVQEVEEDDKSERYLIIAEEVAEDLRPRPDELRQLIGLSDRNRFRITDRVTNLKDNEISIQTRSVMAMMEFMAQFRLSTSKMDGSSTMGCRTVKVKWRRHRSPLKCIQVKTFREMCLPPYVLGTTGTILITPILQASGL